MCIPPCVVIMHCYRSDLPIQRLITSTIRVRARVRVKVKVKVRVRTRVRSYDSTPQSHRQQQLRPPMGFRVNVRVRAQSIPPATASPSPWGLRLSNQVWCHSYRVRVGHC